jgi:hypothetical protein
LAIFRGLLSSLAFVAYASTYMVGILRMIKNDNSDDDNNNSNLIKIEFRVYEMMHIAKQANCIKLNSGFTK